MGNNEKLHGKLSKPRNILNIDGIWDQSTFFHMDLRHSSHMGASPRLAHFDDQIPEVVRRRDGQIEVETSGQIAQ